MARNLEETLQALYDSQINITISWLWNGGIDFAFHVDPEPHKFHNVRTVAELADALHEHALRDYPQSTYATGKAFELERLTGVSPECQRGDCGACPGYYTSNAGTVFCIHDCHQLPVSEFPVKTLCPNAT